MHNVCFNLLWPIGPFNIHTILLVREHTYKKIFTHIKEILCLHQHDARMLLRINYDDYFDKQKYLELFQQIAYIHVLRYWTAYVILKRFIYGDDPNQI